MKLAHEIGPGSIGQTSRTELPWPDEPAAIVSGQCYTFAELINIAQRRNKDTRIAWGQARQAAIGVGRMCRQGAHVQCCPVDRKRPAAEPAMIRVFGPLAALGIILLR